MTTPRSEGTDGFAVELHALDGLLPVFDEVDHTVRSARRLASTSGAEATGHDELGRLVTQFVTTLAELLDRGTAANAFDRQRIRAVRQGYDDIEQTNAVRMLRTDQWLNDLIGPSLLDSLRTSPSSASPPVSGETDRVPSSGVRGR